MKKFKKSELGKFSIDTDNFGKFEIKQKAPDGSPFDDLPFTGDLEKDAKMELNEYQKSLRDSKRKYENTINGIFDSEFWCAFAFKDRNECEAFLREFGLNPKEKFFNGREFVKQIRNLIDK